VTTLQIAAALFVLGALGGIGLLVLRLRGSNPPLGFAVVHGLAAAAGLVTLAVAVYGDGLAGAPRNAFYFFLAAALGGFVLVSIHLRGRLLPIPLILVHGALAATGLVILLLHVFA
jgi:hypothetical protein